MSVSFKTTKNKTTINPGKIGKKHSQAYIQVDVKFLLNFTLTQGKANRFLNN